MPHGRSCGHVPRAEGISQRVDSVNFGEIFYSGTSKTPRDFGLPDEPDFRGVLAA
jgi:hypothetical protein